MASEHVHRREAGRGKEFRDYLPLIVILTLTLLASLARQIPADGWSAMRWMHDFMGFFLVIFSMFKFFDLEGFADGFHMYDLLAMRARAYGYVYPFLELGLGLGYLSRWNPPLVYAATVVLMGFGAVGVLMALRRKLDIECACLGTVLHVPLSTVALVEDLGMAAMAFGMLIASMGAGG